MKMALVQKIPTFLTLIWSIFFLSFNSAFGQNPDYLQFDVEQNGTLTIFIPNDFVMNQAATISDPPQNGTVSLLPPEALGFDPNDPFVANIDLFVIYTPDTDFTGLDSFLINVCDTVSQECGDYGIAVNVGATGGNGPVHIESDFFNIIIDTPTSLDVLLNDSGSNLTITSVTLPLSGQAIISNNQISYIPLAGYTGDDSFFYTACDDNNNCGDGFVYVHIADTTNTDPGSGGDPNGGGALATTFDVPFNTPVQFFLPTEIIGNQEWTVVNAPQNGSIQFIPADALGLPPGDPLLEGVEIIVQYTPNTGFSGVDIASFIVVDTIATDTILADITFVVGSAVSLNPTDDFVTTQVNESVDIHPLLNDLGSGLFVSDFSLPQNGTAVLDPATNIISYTPDTDFIGSDQIIYTVCDFNGSCLDAVINISIQETVEDHPDYFAAFTTFENTPIIIFDELAFGIFTDSVTIISGPANGTLDVDNYVWTYTPDSGFVGMDTVLANACLAPGFCLDFQFIVEVLPQSSNFGANDDFFTVPGNVSTLLDVLANDEGNSLFITEVSTASNGTVANLGTALQYTPNPDFAGNDQFIYTVCDGLGNCEDAVVFLSVSGGSIADISETYTVEELSALLITSFDISGIPGASLTITEAPQNGTAQIVGDGIFYIPNDGFLGIDTFYVEACVLPVGCFNVELIINVVPIGSNFQVNDDDFSVNPGDAVPLDVLGNDAGGGLTISDFTLPAQGALTLDGNQFLYTSDPGATGTDQFTYTACNSLGDCQTATVYITFIDNTVPAFTINYTIEEGEELNVNALDILGLPFAGPITVLENPANGTLAIDTSNNSVTYIPDSSFIGQDTFFIEVCFFVPSGCFTVLVFVDVVPTGGNFAAIDDFFFVTPDVQANLDVLANDTGSDLYINAVTDAANGTTGIENGQVFYDPDPGFLGTDAFSYLVCNGNGDCLSANVSIQVSAPNVVFFDYSTPKDVALILPVDFSFIPGFAISTFSDPINGTVEIVQVDTTLIDNNGAEVSYPFGYVRYTPNSGYTGPDMFELGFNPDPLGLNLVYTFNIEVLPTQDCLDNCVWPGDANNNGIVDVYDLMAIGLTYNQTGPARANPTLDWIGQTANDWGTTIEGLEIDTKFADCDGNGIVEATDTMAIIQNYNLTHGIPQLIETQTASQEITLVPTDPTMTPGEMMEIEIHVGSASMPTSGMYGFAGKFLYDPLFVDPASIVVEMEPGNFLTDGSEMLSLVVNHFNGQLDIAYTRTDGMPVSGFGIVGTISYIVTDNIDGFQAPAEGLLPTTMEISLADTYMMDANGVMYTLNTEPVTIPLDPGTTTSVTDLEETVSLSVYPNPTSDLFNIELEANGQTLKAINVYDTYGRLIDRSVAQDVKVQLNTVNWQSGVYILEVILTDGTVKREKVEVIR